MHQEVTALANEQNSNQKVSLPKHFDMEQFKHEVAEEIGIKLQPRANVQKQAAEQNSQEQS